MRYLIALLLCLPALAQEPRGRENLPTVQPEDVEAPALFAEVVTPITIRPGETPLQPDEKRVIVHARPVWRVDDAGALAPISTAVDSGIETLKQVWRADANTVRFRVTEDGLCVYKAGHHVLRVKPIKSQAEATDGSTLANADQIKPTDTTTQTDRIVQRGSFSDIRFEHIVEPGSIKEIAWLDAAPAGIATARWYVLAYRWDSDTLTPTIVNGDVLWKTADEKAIFRWPAPVVTDATGKDLRANYRMRVAFPNIIAVLVNATDLRVATYPVALDPTTTTGSGGGLANRSIRTSNTLKKYKKAFLKITLPDMTGNTVTAATADFYRTDSDAAVSSISTYARAVADTGAWDETSTYTTLDALSLGTAISTGQTIATGISTKTFDLFGDSTKGISKFYTDYPSGGNCTIAFEWTAWSGTLTTVITTLALAEEVNSPFCVFATRADGTNYPRVTITYTTAGGSNGSFFFGGN